MSHGVVRSPPYASQLHLDSILDEVLQSGFTGATRREDINLPQVLFYCMKKNPNDVFMTNAASGEKFTNAQIFKHAVSIARAVVAKGARGKNVMILMRNHQTMMAVYLAVLFAEAVPFMMDPNCTVFETAHFLGLIEPCMVFCDEEHYSDVTTALAGLPELKSEVWVANKEERLKELTNGYSDDPEGFLCYYTQFPTPTECCMVLTTPQWVTFTMTVTSCTVYRVSILMSERQPTVEWVEEMLVKFRPSWTFFGPSFLKTLIPTLTADHLSSMEMMLILGAASSVELKTAIRAKLPASAILADVYGTTESQGYITVADLGAPIESTGRVSNIYEYKLVDDYGKQVEKGQNGELHVRGPSLIKGYYKDQASYDEAFENGWFKTGDLFYIDEEERTYYHERKKFCFKYLGCHVSPEEVENVISLVPGVKECVVCATEDGPAAIVVPQDVTVTREQIHQVVNDTLSDHKRIHGGIAFLPTLPHTHSGKIKREECKMLIKELLKTGKCC